MNSDLLITKTTAYVNPKVTTEIVLKLKDEKPAKKEAGAFYGRERQVGIVYDLEHLDEHEYRKYSA
ncbi:predicted protein [Pyrenophora tritici-repentis Pt-1C-BFP]|uniref:Uncharacterized protein n=1 Tax=Pyrenophora tritici-repentis (strain Pt-1C-BFP) TaxID=426418 RepID=B2W7W3_PYRTR|nr:uncharacterized protein PTRG_05901 [Pyrenophora tritici-repentis Pt-1C-BFP]EDU48821.1 predicted protein [Pyrenophora tritici-repentis Pt-1C-BFP]